MDSPATWPATLRQRLSEVEMRISVLQTRLREAERERDTRRKRHQPTRMVETIVEIIAGDLDRMTRHRREMLSARGCLDHSEP